MTPELLKYLCDPLTKQKLELINPEYNSQRHIISGQLKAVNGNTYPITNGIPRFVSDPELKKTVESFGDEWNYFNFTDFKVNWLTHTVKNTFGSADVFKDKLIIDEGGGSGAQTLWMLQSGAKHVILLDLSHAVDDVIPRNLEGSGFKNYDIIQCSIDAPPLLDNSINGIVICHNVIQHTPSVEKTASALFSIVAPGGEFVFNCYPLNDQGLFRWFRYHFIYTPLRKILSNLPFSLILLYSKIMGCLRLLPILGFLLEKLLFCVQGDIPIIKDEIFFNRLKRRYKSIILNTFDWYGAHQYQHLKKDSEVITLINTLQPDSNKIINKNIYFKRPQPIGCALRIIK